MDIELSSLLEKDSDALSFLSGLNELTDEELLEVLNENENIRRYILSNLKTIKVRIENIEKFHSLHKKTCSDKEFCYRIKLRTSDKDADDFIASLDDATFMYHGKKNYVSKAIDRIPELNRRRAKLVENNAMRSSAG